MHTNWGNYMVASVKTAGLNVFQETENWSLPAASLNNPVLSVHSGVCESASSLSPEAVETKTEEWLYLDLLNIQSQKK